MMCRKKVVDGAVMLLLVVALLGVARDVLAEEGECVTGCEAACVKHWGDWGR